MNQDKQAEALRLADQIESKFCTDEEAVIAEELRHQHARIAELEGNLADVVQTVFDALQDKIDATGPIAKSNLQLYVNMLRDAFVADLAAPQAQDVQDVSSAVDALVTAAFLEGGVSAANTEAARQLTEQRKQELQAAIAASAKGGAE